MRVLIDEPHYRGHTNCSANYNTCKFFYPANDFELFHQLSQFMCLFVNPMMFARLECCPRSAMAYGLLRDFDVAGEYKDVARSPRRQVLRKLESQLAYTDQLTSLQFIWRPSTTTTPSSVL
jgi:hypothetical protein